MEANVAAAQGSEKISGIWDHRHDKGPEAKILWATGRLLPWEKWEALEKFQAKKLFEMTCF